MQEEVENRTVTLAISTTKMSANVLKSAISKYLAYCKEKKMEKAREGPVKPCGKQTVKQLVGQNQGVSNIEITDQNIKDFERIARKYGVDFALKKDRTGDKPKYLVFFKARDADALTAAFREYTAKTDRKKERPSVLKIFCVKKQMMFMAADCPFTSGASSTRLRTLVRSPIWKSWWQPSEAARSLLVWFCRHSRSSRLCTRTMQIRSSATWTPESSLAAPSLPR